MIITCHRDDAGRIERPDIELECPGVFRAERLAGAGIRGRRGRVDAAIRSAGVRRGRRTAAGVGEARHHGRQFQYERNFV